MGKILAALLSFSSAHAIFTFGCAQGEESPPPAPDRPQCFSMAQTREKIETHKLTDPFQCLRAAAQGLQGQPLGARLCKLNEVFMYEISVLKPDGRIVKILVDAATGRAHSDRKDNKEN